MIGILCLSVAGRLGAQPVGLNFFAQGPGALVVRCPAPYVAGQGLILNAQPLSNARFIGWEDGSTASERFTIVSANKTDFIAYFTDVNAPSFSSTLGWTNLDLSGFAPVQYPLIGVRNRLTFTLTARQSYQIFETKNLTTGSFTQIPFALSSNGPLTSIQKTAEAGTINDWVPAATNSLPAFYRVRLNGSANYPSLFMAQTLNAPPGATLYLYGESLTGTPTAWANTNAIAVQSISDNLLQITLPSTGGSNFITVAINGLAVLGGFPINILTNTSSLPVITSVSSLPAESGGFLQVFGTNLTVQSVFYLEGTPVPVLSVSTNGNAAVLQLPANLGGSRRLTVTGGGGLSLPFSVSLHQNAYAFAPTTTAGKKVYSWQPYQPNTFSYSPNSWPVKLYAWSPNQPNSYNYNPTTSGGLRIYSWMPNQPNAYASTPASPAGVRVYSWSAYSPQNYQLTPATRTGVKVSSP